MTDSLDFELPKVLWKYRSLDAQHPERLRDIFVKHKIWMSKIDEFNDPFDCSPLADSKGTLSEWKQHFREVGRSQTEHLPKHAQKKTIAGLMDRNPLFRNKWLGKEAGDEHLRKLIVTTLNQTGVFSMSEINNDILMWSHYADSHKGVCIGFDPEKMAAFPPFRIKYSELRPSINLRTDNGIPIIEKGLLTKSDHWQYEREWRLIERKFTGPFDIPRDCIKYVVFGARITTDVEELVRKWTREGWLAVVFFRAVLSKTAFEVTIEPA